MPKEKSGSAATPAVAISSSATAPSAPAPPEKKRKPRDSHAPYKPRKPKEPLAPEDKTSDTLQTGKHLSYGEWLTVIEFRKSHPTMSQSAVAAHFRAKGWKVSQEQLSRQLKREAEIRELIAATPNGMHAKRPRVVTNPQVERALVLWFQGMEARGEVVTGPMLMAKRGRFEALFEVPEKERLSGDGWIDSFKKAYHIKEHRRHGEAGSVDLAAADAERIRLQGVISKYSKKDTFNGDEAALFAYAPPDRGLSTKQMSGKKSSKFRITLFFVCNADGSEKEDLMFIGKSKEPRCFKDKRAEVRKFYYRNNKKAWMNAYLFEEWLKAFDLKMRRQNRKVLFLLDNFAGHSIAYKPRNVHVEFLAPNMTSHIQPLDAGIIRAFKAHYRRAFCLHALDADDAGEPDIWKINLLEAMHMARRAWDEITVDTIQHCWLHTGILPECAKPVPSSTALPPAASPAAAPAPPTIAPSTPAHTAPAAPAPDPDPISAAWAVVYDFLASDDATLPQAEQALRRILGDTAVTDPWKTALSIANCEKGEETAALAALQKLQEGARSTSRQTVEVPSTGHVTRARARDAVRAELDLQEQIKKLRERNRIWDVPTMDELLDPPEERQVGEGPHELATDEEIVQAVHDEDTAKLAEAAGETIAETQSDEEDDEVPGTHATNEELLRACDEIMDACVRLGFDNVLEVKHELLKVKGELRRVQMQTATQRTITSFFRPSTSGSAGVGNPGATHTTDAMDVEPPPSSDIASTSAEVVVIE